MTKEQKNRAVCKAIAEKSAMLNALKKEVEDLKAYLRIETGEETTDFGTWEVVFTPRTTPSVDAKRLKDEMPEVFEKFDTTKTVNVMKVKEKKR